MTRELDSRIKELCQRIIKEKDNHLFQDLVIELNLRLEERDRGIVDRENRLA
jgi:hypothetical protein